MSGMLRQLRPLSIVLLASLGSGCAWNPLKPDLGGLLGQRDAPAEIITRPSPTHEKPVPTDAIKQPESPTPVAISTPTRKIATSTDLWPQVAADFTFDGADRPEVVREITAYRAQVKTLNAAASRAAPYLAYIAEQLRTRQLPSDLVLLPILESGYDSSVTSPYGAAGLWQFMGGTGNKFGLTRDDWIDERLDVVASTDAALTYLTTLSNRFNGDWLTAIAAYNAGWGNIERAIAQNKSRGKSTNFWSLELRSETRKLVARMLALVEIFRAPDRHGLTLGKVPTQPYFAAVTLTKPADLRQLATSSGLTVDELKALNPQLRRWHTGPSAGRRILVPASHSVAVSRSALQLAAAPLPLNERTPMQAASRDTRTPNHAYLARRGDSLWTIARRFDTRVAELERLNRISRAHPLRIGQRIVVRANDVPSHKSAAQQVYRVREGDSLWTISRRFNVTIGQLLSWNGLDADHTLRPGETLVIADSG